MQWAQTMRKLRALAIAAHYKIHKNRYKNIPGKWPEKAYEAGERSWMKSPLYFLEDKLAEEKSELIEAARDLIVAYADNSGSEPSVSVLQCHAEACLHEAGDVTAVAMMLADRSGLFEALKTTNGLPPKVVCLCGSTKFKATFEQANYKETMEGNIVLTVGSFMHADGVEFTDLQKQQLDWLHKRKIDLADEIFVLNVDGYIGESTRSEIEYARETGKGIRYLVIPND